MKNLVDLERFVSELAQVVYELDPRDQVTLFAAGKILKQLAER